MFTYGGALFYADIWRVSTTKKMRSIFEMALRYEEKGDAFFITYKEKAVCADCFFIGGGYFILFYPKWSAFQNREGVPAASRGS